MTLMRLDIGTFAIGYWLFDLSNIILIKMPKKEIVLSPKTTLWLEFIDPTPWSSTQILQKNYRELYQEVESDLVVKAIAWNEYLDPNFWSSLKALNLSTVILADMRFDLVHWLPLIQKNLSSEISIQVHIYGNPIKRMMRLDQASIDFTSLKLSFMVGSTVQQKVFEKILNDSKNVTYLPFIPDAYVFNSEKRLNWREKNHFQNEKLFLYSGRISFQKNVTHLMDLFALHAQSHPNSRLIIAGAPDNLNWREVPRANYLNYAAEVFFEKLQTLTHKGIPISYLGKLTHSELEDVYNGCDHFVSLSTFDGEDFGLSIAESLSVGLPSSLTSWGGYKEFQDLPQVQLVEVEIQQGQLGIDQAQWLQALDLVSTDRVQNIEQFNLWKKNRENHCLKTLREAKHFSFQGFNQTFKNSCRDQFKTGEFFEREKEFLSSYWD